MSTILLTVIIGLFLLGGVVLFAGIFLEQSPTPKQIESEQDELGEITNPDKLVEMAERYEKHDKWGPAINTWSRYLELQPEAEQARFRRGVARQEDGRHQSALEDLEQVLDNVDEPPAQVHLYVARAHRALDDGVTALAQYQNYLDRHPGDRSVANEAAELARSIDRPTEAREIYENLRDSGETESFVDATLSLVDMDIDQQEPERAEDHFEDLKEYYEEDRLTDEQRWEYLYQKARKRELDGQQEEADQLFRDIYREKPDFRDVRNIVEEHIYSMSEDELIRKMLSMDRDEFIRYCEDLVGFMGYEVMSSDSINPDEVEIHAREKASMMKVNRVLFAFKKWDNQAGEIPLKEFELKMLEERYDRGFFVCPGGFNHKAKDYEENSPDLELVGPQRLLSYLREAEKQQI